MMTTPATIHILVYLSTLVSSSGRDGRLGGEREVEDILGCG